jgi:hypothetical protein
MSATGALSKTMSAYYQNVAGEQLKSYEAKLNAENGLWSTLIGAGAQGLAAGAKEAFSSTPQPTTMPTDTSENPALTEARDKFMNGPKIAEPMPTRASPDFSSPLMNYQGGR